MGDCGGCGARKWRGGGLALIHWLHSVLVGFQEHLSSDADGTLGSGAGAGTLRSGAGAGAIGDSSAWCMRRLVVWARAWTSLSVSGSIVP